MMESSNLNLDLHHQEDFHASSSSISPSFNFVSRNQDWNQDLLLNSADHNFIPITNGTMRHDMPIVQDLGFQWSHDQEGNIKEELTQDYHQVNGLPPPVAGLGFDPVGGFGRGSFSVVFPTANVSGLNQLPDSSYSNSVGMDVQAMDLLALSRFGRTLCQPMMDNMALLREDLAYGMNESPHNKISHTISGVTNDRAHKANGNSLEYKSSQSVAKKPRFESRSSFAPFKVRKEKLGDRIAALQQLVAPFGKTDTASVLMEAIGYIKFLQDQVETLSVPYMRSSNTKKSRVSEEISSEEKDETKLDLRSRGLCLVPLSCTSYVTNENGGIWSPPNYRGGT